MTSSSGSKLPWISSLKHCFGFVDSSIAFPSIDSVTFFDCCDCARRNFFCLFVHSPLWRQTSYWACSDDKRVEWPDQDRKYFNKRKKLISINLPTRLFEPESHRRTSSRATQFAYLWGLATTRSSDSAFSLTAPCSIHIVLNEFSSHGC